MCCNSVIFVSTESVTQLFLAQKVVETALKEKEATEEVQQKAIDELQCKLT